MTGKLVEFAENTCDKMYTSVTSLVSKLFFYSVFSSHSYFFSIPDFMHERPIIIHSRLFFRKIHVMLVYTA